MLTSVSGISLDGPERAMSDLVAYNMGENSDSYRWRGIGVVEPESEYLSD